MYIHRERVCTSRTGIDGVMKLSGAIDVIQDCSVLWMESEPSFKDYLIRNNLGMVLVSRQADILRLPKYGESITLKTGIFSCTKFYGYRNTVLYGEDGAPGVLSWCVGSFIDRGTGRLVSVPQDEIDKITIDEKVEMEYLDKKIAVPSLEGRVLEPVAVLRCDIDFNRHMNNARYIEKALEFLPLDFEVRRARVEYKKPARPGDLLYPRVIFDGGVYFVLLEDGGGKPFAVVEFS